MNRNKLYIILISLIIAAAMLLSSGCSAIGELFNGASASEVLAAAEADVVGEPAQEYNEIIVRLPIHAGYTAIENKLAYESLSNDNQRIAYSLIEKSIFCITSVSGGDNGAYQLVRAQLPPLSSAEIFMVKEAVLADHPEAFWVTGNYSLGYNLHDGNFIVLYSNYSYDEIFTMLKRVENEVAAILKEIPSNRSEYERELIIHDCLVRDVDYDSLAAELRERYTISSTVYGTLVNKQALCSGYSQTAKLLLNIVGVSCGTVKGISKQVGHMWNIVCIGGSWYHLDITWDDPVNSDGQSGVDHYDYFNLPDEYITKDHEISENYDMLNDSVIAAQNGSSINFYNFDMPLCTSLAQNYYEINCTRLYDLSDGSAETIAAIMVQMSLEGEMNMYIRMPDIAFDQQSVQQWLDESIEKGMLKANSSAKANGGKKIQKCARVVRTDDNSTVWSNVYCVKLFFEE